MVETSSINFPTCSRVQRNPIKIGIEAEIVFITATH
jgi:hypothetical protein